MKGVDEIRVFAMRRMSLSLRLSQWFMGEWRGLGGEDEEERERVRVEERIFLFVIIRIFTSRPKIWARQM